MSAIARAALAAFLICAHGALAEGQTPGKLDIIANSGHSGGVVSVAVAPNRQWIASASKDGLIKLWDVATGRLLRTLRGHSGPVNQVAIAPDGQLVASASDDETIKLWDPETGRLVRTLTSGPHFINKIRSNARFSSVAFSPDGVTIASGSWDSAVKFWDTTSGRLLRTIPSGGVNLVMSVVFSPDGSEVWAGTYEGQLQVLDAHSGRTIRTFKAHPKSTRTIAISSDGQTVVSTGGDYRDAAIRIWDRKSAQLLHTLSQGEYVPQAAFSPDGRLIVASGSSVKVWDRASGRLLRSFGEKNYPSSVGFFPSGPMIVTGEAEALTIWDADTGQLLRDIGARNVHANVAAIDDDRWLVIGPGGVTTWDAGSGQLAAVYQPEFEEATNSGVVRDNENRPMTLTTVNRTVKLWNLNDGRVVRDFKIGTEYPWIKSPVVSKDARWLALSVELKDERKRLDLKQMLAGQNLAPMKDKLTLKVLDATNAHLARSLPAFTHSVGAIAFAPDGRSVAVVGVDAPAKAFQGPSETIKIWDIGTGQLARTVKLTSSSDFLTFSPDGRLLVTSFVATQRGDLHKLIPNLSPHNLPDLRAAIWDARTGQIMRVLHRENMDINGVVFSPSGQSILGLGKLTPIWDVATGRLIRTLEGNIGDPISAAFSPDGRRIIVGNWNGTTAVWDSESGNPLTTTVTRRDGEWVTITPEGFFAASARGAELLHVVRGFETIGIDQFYQSLYRPDLVREKLAGDSRGLVREAAARLDLDKVLASGNAPGVTMISPREGERTSTAQINAEIELAARDGGVGRVEWRVNGVTVGVDPAPPAPPAGQPLRLTRGLTLEEGDNEIEVVVYNGPNLIASVPARATVTGPTVTSSEPARLFVLAVGLNDYADERFKLNYAVRDAKALTDALQATGKGLYSEVNVTLVSDGDVRRAKLETAFADLAGTVRPSDVFVFFAAGHGKTVDGRYYFVPQDFKLDGDRSNPAVVNKAVASQGIAQEQWQAWFATIPAKKSVLLFDTCEAGTLTGEGRETHALERGAANDRLAQATGRTILTASAGDKDALEGFRNHGLFTYSLLEALERADSDGNGKIDVAELATYVHAQVTALSEKVFAQRQVPQVRITSNYAFANPARVLHEAASEIVISDKPTHRVATGAELLVVPSLGSRRIRKLADNTPLTLVKSEGGWTLVAREGRPVGYVATRDLAPLQ